MSRSVDLFVSSPETLDVVAAAIGEIDEITVEAGSDGSWNVREGATSASLSSHGYVDDGDLLLSSYRYVLSGRTAATARPQDTPVAGLLRHVGSQLRQRTPWAVLLVLDLQYREPVPVAGDDAVGGADGTSR